MLVCRSTVTRGFCETVVRDDADGTGVSGGRSHEAKDSIDERPVTIEEGTNILAGTRKDTILRAWAEMKRNPKTGRVPKYWDGSAAGRCVEALRGFFSKFR